MSQAPAVSAIRSDRVVLPDGVAAATLVVSGGRIVEVLGFGEGPTTAVDCSGLVVSPGLVDSHVHVNEPGRTHWEGFATATRAAAAGGVTTIVDMPLNSIPPTTTVEALEVKRAVAAPRSWVDVAFWGGVTGSDASSVPALGAAGVCGYKVFLVDSGVEEFPAVTTEGLYAALRAARRTHRPVIVHAEAPGPLAAAPAAAGPVFADYVASRPPEAEVEAVRLLITAVRDTGAAAHVLHLSAADCLPLLRSARSEGLPITVETCPHYLSLVAELVPDGATQCKCAPPVRGAANRDRLWDGLFDGTIDLIASDHSPAPPEVKSLDTGDFGTAWGGIAGLQTALPVVWTEARERGATLADIARWQAAAPAALAGLPGKGCLRAGNDADLVVWDPEGEIRVDAQQLAYRHPISAWDGRTLRGRVDSTWVRGRRVDPTAAPKGVLLRRGDRVP